MVVEVEVVGKVAVMVIAVVMAMVLLVAVIPGPSGTLHNLSSP